MIRVIILGSVTRSYHPIDHDCLGMVPPILGVGRARVGTSDAAGIVHEIVEVVSMRERYQAMR